MKDRWQKVKELYEAALMLSPDERSGFLDERCDGDNELRREVESLLSFSDDAESFLEKPAVGEVAEIIVPKDEKLEMGRNFGHYGVLSTKAQFLTLSSPLSHKIGQFSRIFDGFHSNFFIFIILLH